jgi:hypothetical protein
MSIDSNIVVRRDFSLLKLYSDLNRVKSGAAHGSVTNRATDRANCPLQSHSP